MVEKILQTVRAYGGGQCIQILQIDGHGAPGFQSIGMGRGWLDTPDGKSIDSGYFDFTFAELQNLARGHNEAAGIAASYLDTLMQLQRLRPFFLSGALAELHGCHVGNGPEGRKLLRGLSNLWGGITVAAGENLQFAISMQLTGPLLRCTPVECSN
jgi:hypothetical protein